MFVRLPLRLGITLLVIALLAGIVAAPWLRPYIADSVPAHAQTLPFTPTPEPTDLPTATATSTPAATATSSPTATLTPSMTSIPTTVTSVTTAVPTVTPTPTALPLGYAPDRCEPNDTLVQPCGIPTEVDVTELNFVDQTRDVYSVLLKANRMYTIRVTSTQGVDPVLAVFLASATDKPVAENDDIGPGSGDAMVEITTTAEAWYLLQIDNKAPGDMKGRLYGVSVRSTAPTTNPGKPGGPTPTPAPAAQAFGDMLENNYDPTSASRISWGVPYDLSLTCPDRFPGACPAGDHDFLLFPVKQGVSLMALTYDLGPGADTFLSLYRPDPAQTSSGDGRIPGWRLITTNDDVAAGWTLRSLVSMTPDWTGEALVVVASSERLNPPMLPEAAGPPGRYRLMVGSPELPVVKQVLEAQQDLPPTPVPTVAPTLEPTAAPTLEDSPSVPTATPVPPAPTSVPLPAAVDTAPADDAREVVKESSVRGLAVVSKDGTRLYGAAPPADGDELASYPEGALVTLLGQSYRGWVKVQPKDSVTPGWMWGPALRPLEITDPNAPQASTTATAGAEGPKGTPVSTPQPGETTTATTPAAGDSDRPATVDEMAPRPLPTDEAARPIARTLTIEVCAQSAKKSKACGTPLSGLRIELVQAATGRVQGQGVTDGSGKVTLSLSIPMGSKLLLRLPALGLQTEIGDNETLIPVRVPGTTGG